MWQQFNDWSKTILLSRAMMPRIQSTIRKENERMLSLGYGSRHYRLGMNTYDFLDRMLSINIRMRNLSELSDVVDMILEDMDSEESRLLRERFFERKSVADILPRANIRTTYRRYNTALEHFTRGLVSYGYDLDSLQEMLDADNIISAIHTRVVNHAIKYRHDDEPAPSNITEAIVRGCDMSVSRTMQLDEMRDERIRA